MPRKQGNRQVYSAKENKGIKQKIITRGERTLNEPRAILLCEDTSSALYYFKFFVRSFDLNVEIEPKTKQEPRSKSKMELDKVFVRAKYFLDTYPDTIIMLAYDLDEFYRKNDPKKSNMYAYEQFVKDNKTNKNIIYLDTFPCFEFWLLIHFCKSKKYYDSYEELFKELTKKCRAHKFPAEAKSSCHYYCKSQKYWDNLCKDLFKYFPKKSLKDAILYSRAYELKIGENSHSNIWKFFKKYASKMDFLSDVFV